MAQIPNYRSASLLYAYKRIRITEVDTQNGYVEGTDSSKQNIKISFKWFYQPFLAVPEVGEDWLVFKMDNNWVLHSRYETGNETVPLSELQPGDHRIDVPGTLHLNANKILINDSALTGQLSGSAFVLPLTLNVNPSAPRLVAESDEAGTALNDYGLFALNKDQEDFSRVLFKYENNVDSIKLKWGSGTSEHDVSLYRSSAETLTLDGNLVVTGALSYGVDSNEVYNISNYTSSRRQFNPATATIQEIGEVLATLIKDLGLATADVNTYTTSPGSAALGPQTILASTIASSFEAGSATINGVTEIPNPQGSTAIPIVNYSANVRPFDPRHIIYMPIPTTVTPHEDSVSIVNTILNGNARLDSFRTLTFTTSANTPRIYVGKTTDPTWTVNGTYTVHAPNSISASSGQHLVILDESSAAYGNLPVEFRMGAVTSVNVGAHTITCGNIGIGAYGNAGGTVALAYRQDTNVGHKGPMTGHAEIAGSNTGSGQSYTVGMIRPIDITRGYIDHAIRVAVGFPRQDTMGTASYEWPAIRSEGGVNAAYCMTTVAGIPMGARLTFQRSVNWEFIADQAANRLSNSLNKNMARIFIRAIYEYGMIMMDVTSGSYDVFFEEDGTASWNSLIGTNHNDIATACAAVIPWGQMMVPALSNWTGYIG